MFSFSFKNITRQRCYFLPVLLPPKTVLLPNGGTIKKNFLIETVTHEILSTWSTYICIYRVTHRVFVWGTLQQHQLPTQLFVHEEFWPSGKALDRKAAIKVQFTFDSSFTLKYVVCRRSPEASCFLQDYRSRKMADIAPFRNCPDSVA